MSVISFIYFNSYQRVIKGGGWAWVRRQENNSFAS